MYYSWMGEAACTGRLDLDTAFFPEGTQPRSYRRATAPAVALCAACPVAAQCLEYALGFERGRAGRWGVWGGMTPDERQDAAVRHARA